MVNVRLENIKLRNKLKKKEQALKSKEELAEGLHLIDFEQLKIENQTYNEKIEERNEVCLKLIKYISKLLLLGFFSSENISFLSYIICKLLCVDVAGLILLIQFI